MAESERFRLFVAVLIPEEVKAKIEEAQAALRRALLERSVRWTRREQFHLTLKFLGDVDAPRFRAVGDALRAACQDFSALRLRAQGVGFFPDLRFPRVAWIGVSDEADQLPRLQQAVALSTREFTAEEPGERFTGHVTLARIRGIKRRDAEVLGQGAAGMAERHFGQWTAHELVLMRSELSPDGARHTSLAAIPLPGLAADMA